MAILTNQPGNDAGCQCRQCGDAEPAKDTDRGVPDDNARVIKVMGTGCRRCRQLHANALEAARRIGDTVRVEYVTDMAEIAAAGVMSVPALIVDDGIVSSGTVPSADEIERILR